MPNRYICSVFEEMRKGIETHNYSYLPGLIEEAQSLANRMESGLEDLQDIRLYSERLSKLRKKYKAYNKLLKELESKIAEEFEEEFEQFEKIGELPEW